MSQKQKEESSVLRAYIAPDISPSLVHPIDESKRNWYFFNLIRDANAGDPLAQHELGLRYFTGKGMGQDTIKGVEWIRRAAMQNLTSARYNLGVFQQNGWGTDWNPFEAYKNFHFAAERNMPDAQYAMAFLLMEGLVVERNEHEALCWLECAADSGDEGAIEVLPEFLKRTQRLKGTDAAKKRPATQNSSSFSLIFIDFTRDTSNRQPDEDELLAEALRSTGLDSTGTPLNSMIDTIQIRKLQSEAEAGSPEALTVLGRMHERGTRVSKDIITASVNYILAMRHDSPRAPELLWSLIQQRDYFTQLKSLVDRGNADAQFVWSMLIALGFDHQLTDQQALGMLQDAVDANHLPSLIELGICYASGRWVQPDRNKALELWEQAARMGSREAAIRLMALEVTGMQDKTSPGDLILQLQDAAESGSVTAQVALGHCHEAGVGFPKDKAEAARYYRNAAKRGSEAGYLALKRLYDELRPKTHEFRLTD